MTKRTNALAAALLAALITPAAAQAGFFEHIIEHAAGYAAGGVAAHEAERAIDDRQSSSNTNKGGVAADGRYAAVAPIEAALPNRKLTPGALNPAVTQENLDDTICRKGGYTKSIRPSQSYTHALKIKQIGEYGYTDTRLYDYEEDHLISLELGGAASDPLNLWPEPHHVVGGWGSYAKDKLENKLHSLVCKRKMTLEQAQHEIATNWIQSYKTRISVTANDTKGR